MLLWVQAVLILLATVGHDPGPPSPAERGAGLRGGVVVVADFMDFSASSSCLSVLAVSTSV